MRPRARKAQAVRRRTAGAFPDWVIKALAAAFVVAAVGSGIRAEDLLEPPSFLRD